MPGIAKNQSLALLVAKLILVTCVTSACNTLGPSTIGNGRMAYNQAISTTDQQQMLLAAVHNRYEERASLLAVASVTANVSVSSRATVQAGFGSKENYVGNLVPFSGGVVYEENPTISYVPVSGEKYLQQTTSPLPLSLLARVTESAIDPGFYYKTLITSVNGLSNHAFLFDGERLDDRFLRFVEIMDVLTRRHSISWVDDYPRPGQQSLVVEHRSPDSASLIEELVSLTGLSDVTLSQQFVVIPVARAAVEVDYSVLRFTTRSVLQLIDILAASVDVPQGDVASGAAVAQRELGLPGQGVRVRFSVDEPESVSVKVEYRGGWYYISDNDLVSKRFFRLLAGLWSAAISGTVDGSGAPVLTVPVSR